MVKSKRVYWLKLPKDFFQSKEIKKLQRRAGGDTFVKIYLKLLLLSLGDEGHILFEQIEDTLAEQLAIEIDEDINDIEALLLYLNHNKLISNNDNGIFMDQIPEMIGSETIDAERKRRERNSGMISKLGHCPEKLGHCPDVSNNVPNIEIEKEKEKELYIENRNNILDKPLLNQFINEVINITGNSLNSVEKAIKKSEVINIPNITMTKCLENIIKPNDFLKKVHLNFFIKEMNIEDIANGKYLNEIKPEIIREVNIAKFDEESFLRG